MISCIQIQPKFIHSQPDSNEPRLAESNEEIIQLFLNCVYQFANFAKKLGFFKNLAIQDQQILLRTSIIELCFLRASFCFDQNLFYRTILIQRNCNETQSSQLASNQNKENQKQFNDYQFSKTPVLRKESLNSFLDDQLLKKFFSFIKQIQECNLDETMIILFALIVLLNPERNQLINCKQISSEQEQYLGK